MLKCLGGLRCAQEKACGPSRAADSARGGGTVSERLELHGVCVWRVRRIAWQKESCRAGSLTWNKDFSLEVAAASWAANSLRSSARPSVISRWRAARPPEAAVGERARRARSAPSGRGLWHKSAHTSFLVDDFLRTTTAHNGKRQIIVGHPVVRVTASAGTSVSSYTVDV